ncbi:hypothetical protein B0H13DRAFT_2291481 [Mycena leptocephala]|nr:hypothetical protein B0H13DRAFT_2291481 [Mycena leptocephala]
MSPLIAFIIGAGRNIGEHTAAALKAKGYQVALGSRKPDEDQIKKDGYFPVAIDAESPEASKSLRPIERSWVRQMRHLQRCILCAATCPEDPLTLSLEGFKQQTDVGLSVYAAAQEAMRGFRSETHKGTLKTFIVTGNALPWIPASDIPSFFGMNIQKVMEWRLMEIFSSAYSKEQARFYYVSLVDAETGGVIEPLSSFYTSGPQHAQVYLDLITRGDQADWEYRFTLDGKQWTK